MQIAKYDAALSFGEGALASATALENVLELGAADPARMAVNVIVKEAAVGGTSVVFNVQGSNNNTDYATVAQSMAVTTANLKAGANIAVPVPQGWNYKFMKVTLTKSGSFTGGKVEAALDVYQGV